ncbi:MAG: type II toxin-antitoxin system ParD family antitoxin [Bacteroidota bacterium]
MPITLPPALEAIVCKHVASGAYTSTDDVLNHALQRFEADSARLSELGNLVDQGLAELDAGEGKPWDAEGFKAEIQTRLAEQQTAAL